MSRIDTGTRFIRAGSWLLMLGFLMSVAVVVHYIVGGEPPGHAFMGNVTLWWGCPWTLPTAVVLGDFSGWHTITTNASVLVAF